MFIYRNSTTKELYAYLLSEAAKPYFGILKEWVCHGVLSDPYHEFMIQERPSLTKDRLKDDFNDVYWEQRYTLHQDAVPSFLEPYKEKILLTGKYLNVLRECSLEVNVEKSVEESFSKLSATGMADVVKVVEGGK